MIDVDIMQDASEVVYYNDPEIPLYVRISELSDYPNMRALCHWHEDIELIYILNGKMNYDINGKKILLNENDAVMVNARQMHYGFSEDLRECRFLCILFHPSLFSGCPRICQEYILPVTEHQGAEYLHFDALSGTDLDVQELFRQIARLRMKSRSGSELEIIGFLHLIWSRIYRRIQDMDIPSCGREKCPDIALQKTMVSYIRQHYGEKIALDDIAASGNVCRSKCCAVFKRYLRQSPIDFLNTYRLKVSGSLLESTDISVTQIALSCGFNHSSYFSKLFRQYYGCTPGQYRDSRQRTGPDLHRD